MSTKIVNTSVVNDKALALLFRELYKKKELELGPNASVEELAIAVAHEINIQVIKPAGERAAAYMLRNYHQALYDALPVGDVDAFDMLKVVNDHLDKVAQAIRMLETQEGVVAPEESK